MVRASGAPVVAVAFEGLTDEALGREVSSIRWTTLGRLGALESALHELAARRLLLVGKIPKTLLLDGRGLASPDGEAIALLESLRGRDDDALLDAVAGWLGSKGFELCDQGRMLSALRTRPATLSRAAPTDAVRADVEAGLPALHALGRVGVGQCVVVSRGVVVALEAVEGTDETIRRAGRLAGAGATVIKAARPGQDLRFDRPAVGPDTIAAMLDAGARALALEADRVLLLEPEETLREADRHGLVVFGFPPDPTREAP